MEQRPSLIKGMESVLALNDQYPLQKGLAALDDIKVEALQVCYQEIGGGRPIRRENSGEGFRMHDRARALPDRRVEGKPRYGLRVELKKGRAAQNSRSITSGDSLPATTFLMEILRRKSPDSPFVVSARASSVIRMVTGRRNAGMNEKSSPPDPSLAMTSGLSRKQSMMRA